MKNCFIGTRLGVGIICAGACAFLSVAHAQQQSTTSEKLELIPAQPSSPQIAPAPVTPAPLPLIPEPPESATKTKATTKTTTTKERKSSTEAAVDELALRVKFRQAKTRALSDPVVQAEWHRANAARTDYEKREALKAYYRALFNRMRRIDASLKPRIAESEQRALHRLTQTRIDPTEPLDPDERADRFYGE
jgi:hypothetical protein